MALIGTLRNKMGKIVVGAIMLTMLAFIGTDLIGKSSLLGGGKEPDIAEIAGTGISNKVFQSKVDELSYYFSLNAGRNPVQQETEQIRGQAWNALVLDHAYQPQFEELGIEVVSAELVDMVQGNNISPQIMQFFTDPSTGQFSKQNVTNFLASLSSAPPQQQNSWIIFERSLIPSRTIQKYTNLLEKTEYVNKYEAKEQYENESTDINVEYLYVPFFSMLDSAVSVSESDLKAYLSSHKEEFKRDEYRNLKYVTFDVKPSGYDSATLLTEVTGLFGELEAAADDSTYVSINSDDPLSFMTYYDAANVPQAVAGQAVGFTSQPEIVNGAYEFYKLSRIDTITSDSLIYRVARMKKEFFVSDETVNEVYRKADMFAASAGNLEEFEREAKALGLTVRPAVRIGKNATRVVNMAEARSLVLWLYNEGEVGAVSDVKEIGENYVVAVMTLKQEEGVANLEEVRNQVEREVRNEKKAEKIMAKLSGSASDDFQAMADAYGDGARVGTANYKVSATSISGVGYAPQAVGISKVLDEAEATQPFQIQDGVVLVKLQSKDAPEGIEDYSSYEAGVLSQRAGSRTIVADFPLTFFRVIVPRGLDESVKENADIEDMRYKFF